MKRFHPFILVLFIFFAAVPSTMSAQKSSVSYPGWHMINISSGLGYDGEENIFGFCLGAEYMLKLAGYENVLFYFGAGLDLDFLVGTGGRSDYSEPLLSFGPIAELLIPIKHGPVYVKTGLKGGYGYGYLKVGDTRRNKTTGFFEGTAGLFVQLGKVGLCVESSVFNYQKKNIKTDNGEFIDNSFKIGFSKQMPLKVGLSILFGNIKTS